jgi:RNA polymerase sigma factor (sigma-70 family)
MDVVALKYSGSGVLHGRSPLLRLQSDEHLIALTRRGNDVAFETLVKRYEVRLLAFCRHMLSSREDAEDVLQEVMAAAYNAIVADERAINARPWLYRIARNRCLNHLRRVQPIGVDSMDVHFSDNGASTADKAGQREAFQMLVDDIQELPETQKTALVLRELEALSYEQISEAMETTVPAVKSLLVRARASLAEAAEARLLSCEEVRIELAETAEGLRRRPSPAVRRHVKTCEHCSIYAKQMRHTGHALAALAPVGPLALLHKVFFGKLALGAWGHGSSAAGTAAAGSGAAVGTGAVAAGTGAAAGSSGLITVGVSALTTKAVAGLAAAALVTAGAVAANKPHKIAHPPATVSAATTNLLNAAQTAAPAGAAAGTVQVLRRRDLATKSRRKQAPPKTAPTAKAAAAHTGTARSTTSVTVAAATANAASAAATAIPITATTPDSGGVGLTTGDGSGSETRSGASTTTTPTGTSTTTTPGGGTTTTTPSGTPPGGTGTTTSTTPTGTNGDGSSGDGANGDGTSGDGTPGTTTTGSNTPGSGAAYTAPTGTTPGDGTPPSSGSAG